MDMVMWIILATLILLAIIAIVAFKKAAKKGKKQEPDYYTFFIMGIIRTVFGVIFFDSLFFFLIFGLALMIIGLANKDKWKNHQTLSRKLKSERKLTIWIMIILGLFVLAGLIAFYLFERGIFG